MNTRLCGRDPHAAGSHQIYYLPMSGGKEQIPTTLLALVYRAMCCIGLPSSRETFPHAVCRQKTVDEKTFCPCAGGVNGRRGTGRGIWCGNCLWLRMGQNIHEILPLCEQACLPLLFPSSDKEDTTEASLVESMPWIVTPCTQGWTSWECG